MAKKQSKKKLVAILIVLLIVLSSITITFVYFNSKQSVLPANCYSNEAFTTSSQYTCPSNSQGCAVTLKLDCTTKSGDNPIVVARTDDTDFSSGWIAYTNGQGGLDSYVYVGDVVGYPNILGIKDTILSNGFVKIIYINKATNNIYVYKGTENREECSACYQYLINQQIKHDDFPSCSIGVLTGSYYKSGSTYCGSTAKEMACITCTQPVYQKYTLKSGADVSTTSKNGCKIVEVCSGTSNTYSCSQCTTGDVTNLCISYSSDSSWSKTTTGTLPAGKKIYWAGDIKGTISWKYSSECTKDVANTENKNSYYKCNVDTYGCGKKSTTLSYCSPSTYVFDEDTQECKPPYTVDVSLEKSVIANNEDFNIDFELTGTTNNRNVPITATILKGSSIESTKTQLTDNSGKTSFSIDAPSIGYYTLRLTFPSTQGDYTKDFNVQVTESLSVVVTADNPIQFDNNAIVVYIKSFQSGYAKALTDFEVDAIYNGNKVSPSITENPSLGVIKLSYSNLKGDGNLRVRVKGQDETGLWTIWTEYFDITVRKSTILFTTDFITDECTGSYKLSFETKDSTGNLVDVQNQIVIDKPLGGSDSATVSGSNGKYSFTYNFVDGGIYTIRITASSDQLGSSQLSSGNGQIVNILTGSACEGGGSSVNKSNYTTWIIIIFVILVIGGFIYFIFKKKK